MTNTPTRDQTVHVTQEGHWDTPDGAKMAAEYAGKSRADLTKGDVSDLALANAVFLASRYDLDLIVWQTAAKERIRWLSAQLAGALSTQTLPVMGEDARERVAAVIRDAVDFDHPDQGHYLRAASAVLREIAVQVNAGAIEGLTAAAVNALGKADDAHSTLAALSTPVKVIETDQEVSHG